MGRKVVRAFFRLPHVEGGPAAPSVKCCCPLAMPSTLTHTHTQLSQSEPISQARNFPDIIHTVFWGLVKFLAPAKGQNMEIGTGSAYSKLSLFLS